MMGKTPTRLIIRDPKDLVPRNCPKCNQLDAYVSGSETSIMIWKCLSCSYGPIIVLPEGIPDGYVDFYDPQNNRFGSVRFPDPDRVHRLRAEKRFEDKGKWEMTNVSSSNRVACSFPARTYQKRSFAFPIALAILMLIAVV